MEQITLINLLSKYNDHNVIACKNINPSKVVFIIEDNPHDEDLFGDIKDYLEEIMPSIEIAKEIIKEVMIKKEKQSNIETIVTKYKDQTTNLAINISGGTKVNSYNLYFAAQKHNIKTILVDMKDDKIYQMKNEQLECIDNIKHLYVEDIIKSTGGQIIVDSTKDFESEEYKGFLEYTHNNYFKWKIIKKILKTSGKVIYDPKNPLSIKIITYQISKNTVVDMVNFFEEMKKYNIITNYKRTAKNFMVSFSTQKYRNMLMISGNWLEALTFKTLGEINGIDNVRGGVRFIWDKKEITVENELDVVAVKHSNLICISCKDTHNYDVEALNELDVYAEQIGGEKVIKIFVTTQMPHKETTIRRAKEMGIHLIKYTGSMKKFKSELEQAIK